MYIEYMEDKKQEKLVFGVRLRSLEIKIALDAVVKNEQKKYPHRGITRNQIVERAIERYIDYYNSWNK